MAIPRYLDRGSPLQGNSVLSALPTLPVGSVSGNLLLAVCVTVNAVDHIWSGTGWVELLQQNITATLTASVAWKIDDGSGARPLCSWSGSANSASCTFMFSGTDQTDPFGTVAFQSGNGTTHADDGIESSRRDSCIAYIEVANTGAHYSQPSGWLERDDIVFDGFGNIAIGTRDVRLTTEPAVDISATGGNADWGLWQIEIMSPEQALPVEGAGWDRQAAVVRGVGTQAAVSRGWQAQGAVK